MTAKKLAEFKKWARARLKKVRRRVELSRYSKADCLLVQYEMPTGDNWPADWKAIADANDAYVAGTGTKEAILEAVEACER